MKIKDLPKIIEGLVQARKEFGCETPDYIAITNAALFLQELQGDMDIPVPSVDRIRCLISEYTGFDSVKDELAQAIHNLITKQRGGG